MPKTCFFKEIASNLFYVNGAPVQFEPLPANRGCLALESPKDDVMIAGLTDAASKHIGGISMISEDAYAQKKTQAASTPLTPPRRKEMLRPMPKGPFAARKQAAAAPANNQPVNRDASPITNSALREANLREAAMIAQSPAVQPHVSTVASAPIPAVEAPGPTAPIEGFRPPTRRISHKPVGSTDSVPAQ